MSRKMMPKTTAKTTYCLTDKDFQQLAPCSTKPNRYNRSGPPVQLYSVQQLESLAITKYGSLEALEAEQRKRDQKRLQRAEANQAKQAAAAQAVAGTVQSQQHEAGQEHSMVGTHATGPGSHSQLGLPPIITERIRSVTPDVKLTAVKPAGEFVLYWMKTAVRAHENPALDVARAQASAWGLPLVTAAFLLTRGPQQYQQHLYCSARRYKFLLEGLRDAALELSAQGQALLVYCEGLTQHTAADSCTSSSPGWDALVQLASRAALVVSEDMPVNPDMGWMQTLAAALPQGLAMWLVDTACIVPMQAVSRGYERAGPFRSATEGLRKSRLKAMYSSSAAPHYAEPSSSTAGRGAACSQPDLDWQPVDLTDASLDIDALLQSWPGIDTTAAPVAHLEGGSRAGYQRWQSFKAHGLSRYAARRNDAMQRDGVSRLSAYHHWGMVSPFRIAREAAAFPGTSKFLDEFLVWREIAYGFCFHRYPALDTLEALPRWARDTLQAHARDPRGQLMTDMQLETGQTGDAFWDACQQQLIATGELHNNARMTWGKALLGWSATPLEALQRTLHLNHKYALDGCDPCSYGGILWCFGLFDGPKAQPGTDVSGSLRQRPTAAHARRLDPMAYRTLPV